MLNLEETILPILESHRLAGLDAGPKAVYPYYDGYNLANLPSSICGWLGVPPFGAQPLAPAMTDQRSGPFRNVIFIVVDGMGLNTLKAAQQSARIDENLSVWNMLDTAVLTSVVPSTTAAALTSFWTGRMPAEHGVVGFEVWLKEYGMIANMIYHSPASFAGMTGSLRHTGFQPETFLPVPVFGTHLRAHGIHPYALQHHSIAHSGLSTMLLRDASILPFRSLSDLFVSLGGLLDQNTRARKYIYVYWGDLDEHSHRFGPHNDRVALELEVFSRHLWRFLRRRSSSGGETLLLLAADHGHLPTPRQPMYEMRNHKEINSCLVMPPSGEARLPYVFLRPGREQRFFDLLENTWNGEFLAVPSQQAIAAGLFGSGQIYERLEDRVGDFVIIPQNDAYWWFGPGDNPLLGRHGGMSRTEMLVPLLSTVIN